eukprot:6149115-Prymnesium_polylepis.1
MHPQLIVATPRSVVCLGAPRKPTDSEKQDVKEGRGDFYGCGCRDWAEAMSGGEGKRMAAEALDFVA